MVVHPRPLLLVLALFAAFWARAVDPPPVPRFVEETDSAGLQSRFEGEGEFQVGGGVATRSSPGSRSIWAAA